MKAVRFFVDTKDMWDVFCSVALTWRFMTVWMERARGLGRFFSILSLAGIFPSFHPHCSGRRPSVISFKAIV